MSGNRYLLDTNAIAVLLQGNSQRICESIYISGYSLFAIASNPTVFSKG
ncbi:hypothetical protein [Coleofasciculus sp. G2-EDA-02]